MDDESTETPAPMSTGRMVFRYVAIGVAVLLFAGFSLLHTMGRSDDFGVMGEWYVMTPLAIGVIGAWWLIERTLWSGR
ncbi:hypothetical protein [Actinoplanes couchii]|uniref:Integral membrane protein n=1 Tax=Actinoplanes couchii TaxID=403638 RepID=A0ABQ3XDS2_9ACTN|nr:hypothetical protein [Actinoplanes couchii]MDR6317152.1 hypothetical protein [Actinoplanes couchii]GID56646.1 hypothetical protein Aco03nite_050500 [Actinoplanes couchii]